MTLPGKVSLLVLVLLCLLGLAAWQVGVNVLASGNQEPSEVPVIVAAPIADQEPGGDDEAVSVKTVHPKRDPNFSATIEQPANVEAYYQADLMARLAGPVKSITHDIGDSVKAGEVLVRIDVP